MEETIELESNEKRRRDILQVVSELSLDTQEKLTAWADVVCLKYNAMPVPEGEETIYMSRDMATELIVTTYFCQDWWPERTNDWLNWNGAIACKRS
jgi:hypothetical protein